MRSLRSVAAAVLAVALLGTTACLTRGAIYAMIGSGVTCTATCPSWSGSTQVATSADFTANFANTGGCPASGSQLVTQSDIASCAVSTAVHTPILSCNTFQAGCFSPWTGGFVGIAGSGYDDGYLAEASTSLFGDYNGTFATVTISQTFTIMGASPTSQSGTFAYRWAHVSSGSDGGIGCLVETGQAQTLTVTVNGNTAYSNATPTDDGSWHNVSLSGSYLTTGSNTIIASVQISGALGQTNHGGICDDNPQAASQLFDVDAFVLTATY